jgi:RNA polymerase sigma-70 factor, ECF subfamily
VIAAEHARAARAEDTDWEVIAGAYDRLHALDPSPVIALNRAVAVAMAHGPEAGLALADEQAGALDAYHLLHATRADLLRRLGRSADARAAYERALELAAVPAERLFLRERLAELGRTAGR